MNGRKLDVYGNWKNIGGIMVNESKQPVTFINLEKDSVNQIKSSGIEFRDVIFFGPGTHMVTDDMKANSLTIETTGILNGGESKIMLKGNWTNKGTFKYDKSTVSFEGTENQQIISSNPENFNNLEVNNNKELLFDNRAGNSIHVHNTLIFNKGIINAEGNGRFVQVDSTVEQAGDGRVFGTMRFFVKPGNSMQLLFAVGSRYEYRPATINFEGTGGTPGYIEVMTEEVNQNFFNSNGGSGIDWNKSIQIKWDINVPQGSTFGLGNRKYTAQLGWTESDLTAFANPMKFNIMRLTNSVWYKTTVTERNNYYTRANNLDGFGSYITGEPVNTEIKTYYSRADGFWFNPSSWSTAGFDGAAATSAPSATDNVIIGNGKSVSLDNNVTVGESVSIIVSGGDNAGTLDCRKFTISGDGAFNLQDNATLIIGSPEGISKSAATGNIRTLSRDFNETGTTKSNFVYSSDQPQHTGDGLPAEVNNLTIKLNEITLDNSVVVNNKLHVESGSLINYAGTADLTVAGDFVTKPGSGFDIGSGKIIFTGTKDQIFNIAGSKIKTGKVVIDKESGAVILENDDLYISKALELNSGVLNARLNNKIVALTNDVAVSIVNGFIDGKVMRFFSSSFNQPFQYPIGVETSFTPVTFDASDMAGNQGYIGAISQKGNHPNFASSNLHPEKLIARYWTISAEAGINQQNIFYDLTINYLPSDLPAGADFNKLLVKAFYDNAWHTATVSARENGSISITGLEKLNADFIIGEDINQGIEDINEIENIVVYPLPAYDKAYIGFYTDKSGSALVSIYNLLGVKISESIIGELIQGWNTIPISLTEINTGSYIYRLTVNGKDYMGSIIKTK